MFQGRRLILVSQIVKYGFHLYLLFFIPGFMLHPVSPRELSGQGCIPNRPLSEPRLLPVAPLARLLEALVALLRDVLASSPLLAQPPG